MGDLFEKQVPCLFSSLQTLYFEVQLFPATGDTPERSPSHATWHVHLFQILRRVQMELRELEKLSRRSSPQVWPRCCGYLSEGGELSVIRSMTRSQWHLCSRGHIQRQARCMMYMHLSCLQEHPGDAHAGLLLRKDTTMLELERIAKQYPEAHVDFELGDVWFDGPGGRKESLQEYESRMLQNKRMRFHRSFTRELAACLFILSS